MVEGTDYVCGATRSARRRDGRRPQSGLLRRHHSLCRSRRQCGTCNDRSPNRGAAAARPNDFERSARTQSRRPVLKAHHGQGNVRSNCIQHNTFTHVCLPQPRTFLSVSAISTQGRMSLATNLSAVSVPYIHVHWVCTARLA